MLSLSFIFLLMLVACLGGGIALIVMSRRGRRPFPSCGKCRYDMTGSLGSVVRCPECGEHFADVGILPPGGGQRSLAMAATGTVLLVIAVGCIGTSVASMMFARASTARAIAQQQAVQAQAAQAQAAQAARAPARTNPPPAPAPETDAP